MIQIALLALLGWVPVVIALFAMLPPRRAVIAAFLGGWMFLPLITIQLSSLPDISKVSVTSCSVLLGVAAFDGKRLFSFRPRWFDLPILVWVAVPFISSLANDRGMWDGASRMLTAIIFWGIPYVIGRVYFTDLPAIRDLALGFVIAGCVYAPLILWEVRMSPQLHKQLYGTVASGMLRGSSLGIPGFRPNVFIGHGLAVSMFMLMCTLCAIWLWKTKAIRAIWGFPIGLLTLGLYGTTILCKVLGTLLVLHIAIVVLCATKQLRTSILVGLLVIAPFAYMFARVTGMFTGDMLLDMAAMVEPTRAGSLQFRLDAEYGIIRNAMERPWFGYGSDPMWRARLVDDPRAASKPNVVTDGMWIIALGQGGVIALAALAGCMLLPAFLVWRRMPVAYWEHPAFAPIIVLAVLLICFMIDSLFNANANMLTLLCAGAVSSMAAALRPTGAQVRARQQQAALQSRTMRATTPLHGGQPSRTRPAYAS